MKNNFLSRKEEIVLTTISLIHEIGVHNVSMKEIGRREGVSEASLYKHFKSKVELFTGVVEYYERFDQHIFQTMEDHSLTIKENILKYFLLYAEYYNNDKEVVSLRGIYNVLSYNINFAGRAQELIEHKTEILITLITRAQKEGELKDSIPAEDLAYIFLGSFDRMIDMWKLKEYSFSLKDRTEGIISSILEAYSK